MSTERQVLRIKDWTPGDWDEVREARMLSVRRLLQKMAEEVPDVADTVNRWGLIENRSRDWPPPPSVIPRLLMGATLAEQLWHQPGCPVNSSEALAEAALFLPIEIDAGLVPIIQLTEAQQEALWHTDPHLGPDMMTVPAESTLPHGALILMRRPIHISDKRKDFVGVIVYPSNRFTYFGLVTRDSRDELATMSFLDGEELFGEGGYEWPVEVDDWMEMKHLCEFAVVCCQVLPFFGLTDREPPTLRIPRAQRRRAERADKSAGGSVSIRYLRDTANEISIGSSQTTGRHVRPHLRRGHVRYVRTGSMSLPREQRGTVRRFIPPCIVNGHLGTPSQIVEYRERTKGDADA